MTADEKMQFDAIAVLWKGAWEQFNERRRFEFQISIALWTALASFTALVVTGKFERVYPITNHVFQSTCGFVFTIFVVYVLWTWGLYRANNFDKKIAFHYADKLQKLSDSEFDITLNNELKRNRKSWKRHWSQAAQIGFTLILSVATILSVYSMMPH